MIGRRGPHGPRLRSAESPEDPAAAQKELTVRWGLGCLIAGIALLGVGLLVALLAFYLKPPAWIQVVVAFFLAAGGVLLAWLVATAVGQREPGESPTRGPRPPNE